MRLALFFVASLVLACGSSWVQRYGPDYAIYCSVGTLEAPILCPKPRLNSGWPAPFLFDTPGISVEGKVSFLEDDFRPAPFAATLAFYLLSLLALAALARRLRGGR